MSSTMVMLAVTGLSMVLATVLVLYRYCRPKFAVKVNCHFCGADTKVPFDNSNCWDCPQCDQYNGFSQDGDYNKPIPAQFKEDFNHPVLPDSTHFNSASEVLCDRCNRNQLLIIKQLSNFEPYNEMNYFAEVASYKRHLEHVYGLCRSCDLKASEIIAKQDAKLSKELGQHEFRHQYKLPRSHLDNSMDSDPDQDISCDESEKNKSKSPLVVDLHTPRHSRILRVVSLTCAFMLFAVDSDTLLKQSDLSWTFADILSPWMLNYLARLRPVGTGVAMLGLSAAIIAVFSQGKKCLHMCDAVTCCVWLLAAMLHSPILTNKLSINDMYVLKAVVMAVCTLLAFWSLLCVRRAILCTTSIRKLKRPSRDNSFASGDSMRESPVIPVRQEKNSHEKEKSTPTKKRDPCVDNFETMSIGTPPKSSSPRGGVFSTLGDRCPTPPPQLSSLRVKGHLIQPARFQPMTHTVAPPCSQQRSIFGAGSKYTSPQSAFGFRTLNGLSALDSGPQLPSNSADDDDRGSLFSEHRYKADHSSDSSDDGDGNSVSHDQEPHVQRPTRQHSRSSSVSRSTVCPVDTTTANVPRSSKKQNRKRQWGSMWVYLLILSILVNILIAAYMLVDWQHLLTDLSHYSLYFIQATQQYAS